jgi:hypothetical protein
MAKKTRRARKASQQQRARRQAESATQQYENAPAGAVAAKPKARGGGRIAGSGLTAAQAAISFREEYHYVVADLKRVGILALVMFAVLIGLAFALPALGI